VLREVACGDHDAVQRILDWPLREMLLAFEGQLKQAALEGYRAARMEWAIRNAFGGKQKPPRLPRILRER
jgi:hypothetical protein